MPLVFFRVGSEGDRDEEGWRMRERKGGYFFGGGVERRRWGGDAVRCSESGKVKNRSWIEAVRKRALTGFFFVSSPLLLLGRGFFSTSSLCKPR